MKHDSKIKSIAVIGGGISGLSAAYYLAQRKYHVTLYERENELGGFARSFRFKQSFLERYYHFICLNDHLLINLINELGLSELLMWKSTAIDYFVKNKLYPFTDPPDMIRFDPLSVFNRLRFLASMLPFKFNLDWRKLDDVPNHIWLKKYGGQAVYDVVWKSLMVKKYHERHEQVPAAWIWGRTHRRASSRTSFLGKEQLGHLQGGSKTLIDAIEHYLLTHNGVVKRADPITRIEKEGYGFKVYSKTDTICFDSIITAIPAPIVAQITPSLPEAYRDRLKRMDYLNVICPIIAIQGKIAEKYWTNIYDYDIPYLGVIEYSRLNPDPGFQGQSIVYLPFYHWPGNPIDNCTDEEIINICLDGLQRMFPWFDRSRVDFWEVPRDKYSQPMTGLGHYKQMLGHETPWQNAFIIDSSMIYPEDRGFNNCIKIAKRMVETYF